MLDVTAVTLSGRLCAALLLSGVFHMAAFAVEPVRTVPEGALVQDMKRAALARLKASSPEAQGASPTVVPMATELVPEVPLRGDVSTREVQVPALATAHVVPAPVPVPVVADTPAVPQRWHLSRGVPVHKQLSGWAEQSGWTVRWQPTVSWLVAADADFEGDFSGAISQVVDSLFFEGKPVRLVLWQSNRVAEVISSDVR